MALRYGFFNSVDGDRIYDANDFGKLISSFITDGIYKDIEGGFSVTPGGQLSVNVAPGRAWFNDTWTYNQSTINLDLGFSDLLLPRYDAVILEIDRRNITRANSIKIIAGTPSANPVKPSLSITSDLYQYVLAYVYIRANQEEIAEGDIQSTIGSASCPYLTAKMDIISIENLFKKMEQQYNDWLDGLKGIADETLLVSLKFRLDEANQEIVSLRAEATRLANEVNAIKAAI